MKLIFLLFAIVACLTGCQHFERMGMEPQERLLVGVWDEEFGVFGRAVSTFRADGSYYGEAYSSANSAAAPVTFEGTWEIREDVLSYTIHKCSDPDYPDIGGTTRDKITKLEEAIFEYESLDHGYTSRMLRQSDL